MGRDIWTERYDVRSQFGYVAQKFSLYPDLTVEENLRFFGGAYRVGGRQLDVRIETLVKQLDLTAKRSALAGQSLRWNAPDARRRVCAHP